MNAYTHCAQVISFVEPYSRVAGQGDVKQNQWHRLILFHKNIYYSYAKINVWSWYVVTLLYNFILQSDVPKLLDIQCNDNATR